MKVTMPPPPIKDTERHIRSVSEELVNTALRSKSILDAMYSNQTEIPTADFVKMWFIEQRRFEQVVQHLRDLAAGQTPY